MRSRNQAQRNALSRMRRRYGPVSEPSDQTLRTQSLASVVNVPTASLASSLGPMTGWMCHRCRRAELAKQPCPEITDHNGDCTCACGLTFRGGP